MEGEVIDLTEYKRERPEDESDLEAWGFAHQIFLAIRDFAGEYKHREDSKDCIDTIMTHLFTLLTGSDQWITLDELRLRLDEIAQLRQPEGHIE